MGLASACTSPPFRITHGGHFWQVYDQRGERHDCQRAIYRRDRYRLTARPQFACGFGRTWNSPPAHGRNPRTRTPRQTRFRAGGCWDRRGGAKVNVLGLESTSDVRGHPPPLENQYTEVPPVRIAAVVDMPVPNRPAFRALTMRVRQGEAAREFREVTATNS